MEHLLTVFIAVTEHGSFTKAGSYLHLTQPTVTASIKQLERKYNAVLLDRTNKYVRLTKSGEVVYHYAKKNAAVPDQDGKRFGRYAPKRRRYSNYRRQLYLRRIYASRCYRQIASYLSQYHASHHDPEFRKHFRLAGT